VVTVSDQAGKVIRTLDAPAAPGVNQIVWDLRYAPPVDSTNVPAVGGGRGGGRGGRGGPPAAVAVGFPPQPEVPGFGRGGVPVGPLVLPGTYTIRVTVPGAAKPLSGTVLVEADALPAFSPADRAARQAILMRIYEWTKALGEARIAARSLVAQRDSIAADFAAGGAPDAGARADSLNARIARVVASIDRALTAVNGERAPIESWSGLPTIDQQKAVGYAIDDGQKAIGALDRLVSSDIPAAYKATARKDWGRRVKAIAAPPTRASR
jgi:hypothetical protein